MNTIDYIFSGFAIFILAFLSFRYYIVRKKNKAVIAKQSEIDLAFIARRRRINESETLEIEEMSRDAITSAMKTVVDKALYEMTLVLPFRYHNAIYWNDDFHGYFDPISKVEELKKGNLGHLFGVKVEVDSMEHSRSYLSKPCLIWK